VLYPAESNPNITITTPIFCYGGQTYMSGGMGNAPGNVLFIEHANGAELHISLPEATSGGNAIELNLTGYEIAFKGEQATLHFNATNHLTQIFTQASEDLTINGTALLAFTAGTLQVHSNNTLSALTFGLEPMDTLSAAYIGAKLVPSTNYTVENNAINLGSTILGGKF
jgi:hypothetical protein